MKATFKYILLAVVAVLSFASCGSDDDYTWATAEGEQVYFPNTLSSTIEISPSASTVTIPVNRVNTTGALTVPLTVSGADGTIYSVPTSVSFSDGSATTNLTISYDPSAIEYGNYSDLTIAIGDAAYTTPYGLSSYSFKIGVTDWGDWSSYNSTGTATYYYEQFWSGSQSGATFRYRHNIISTNLYEFQIDSVMGGITFTFSYDSSTGLVTADPQFTGYTHSTYGDVYVCDYNYYWTTVRGRTLTDDQKLDGYFDAAQGIFHIPLVYYVSAGYFGSGYEEIWIDGVSRADYSTSVSYLGKLLNDAGDPANVYASVTLGEDVESANVALVSGKEVSDETLAAIVDGSYTPLVQITASGEVKFDARDLEEGMYTIVVVPFGGGQAQQASISTETFKYTKGISEWESLGIGQYTEDAIGGLYSGTEPQTYEVEIQQSVKTPGLYRLVNPYGAAYPYNSEGDYDTSRNYYIEVNAVDPDGVYIEKQRTGCNWGDGEFYLQSMGSYYMDNGYSLDVVKSAGAAGTLSNGTITFPTRGLLVWIGSDSYYGNTNGAAKIVLPTASASAKKKALKANRHLQHGALSASKGWIIPLLHHI